MSINYEHFNKLSLAEASREWQRLAPEQLAAAMEKHPAILFQSALERADLVATLALIPDLHVQDLSECWKKYTDGIKKMICSKDFDEMKELPDIAEKLVIQKYGKGFKARVATQFIKSKIKALKAKSHADRILFINKNLPA